MGTVLMGDYGGGHGRWRVACVGLVRGGLVWNDPRGKPRGSHAGWWDGRGVSLLCCDWAIGKSGGSEDKNPNGKG
jgi:hypothetical protein